jgi:hypothetical protein
MDAWKDGRTWVCELEVSFFSSLITCIFCFIDLLVVSFLYCMLDSWFVVHRFVIQIMRLVL